MTVDPPTRDRRAGAPRPSNRHRVLRLAVAVACTAGLTAGAASCSDDGGGSSGTSDTQVPATEPTTTTNGSTTEADGATSSSAPADPDAVPEVDGTPVAGLDAPIALLPRPGDDDLWVAERGGTVRRLMVAGDRTLHPDGEPVLDISDDTTTDGERGLLGIAFSDDGGTLFVSHTDAAGDSRVAAYAIDGDAVDVDSRRVLVSVDQPYANHNGGNVVLGPDGKLWVGFGDGGAANDPENRAQDPDTILGKIVRVDPDGGEPEIVVSGVRNPWRFSFDTDGSLWVADVGQNRFEEIDHLPADRIDGANLGWSGYEGSEPHLDGDGRRPADPVMPVFTYGREGGNCSITGGLVYRGEAIPALRGAYLFADYCAGRVRAVTLDDAGAFGRELDLGVDVDQPISFGTDADGEAYVLSATGTVTRLDPAG